MAIELGKVVSIVFLVTTQKIKLELELSLDRCQRSLSKKRKISISNQDEAMSSIMKIASYISFNKKNSMTWQPILLNNSFWAYKEGVWQDQLVILTFATRV